MSRLSLLLPISALALVLTSPAPAAWQPGYSAPGTNGYIYSTSTWNGDLVIGGLFTLVNDVLANRIARFDGTTWHPLGSGLNGTVRHLVEHQGHIVAAGSFTQAGDRPIAGIARWDGLQWLALGEGLTGELRGLRVRDDLLYAWGKNIIDDGGAFSHIAIWDGDHWWPYPTGEIGPVSDLVFHGGEMVALREELATNDPIPSCIVLRQGDAWQPIGDLAELRRGQLVIYGGSILAVESDYDQARFFEWTGAEWTVLDCWFYASIGCLAVIQDLLYVNGSRYSPDKSTSFIYTWDGSNWEHWSPAPPGWTSSSMLEWNGLIVCAGGFTAIRNRMANRLAAWNGEAWTTLGSCGHGITPEVYSLSVHRDQLAISGQGLMAIRNGDALRLQFPLYHYGSSGSRVGNIARS